MGDVGKEAHVHLVDALFLFLFYLSLPSHFLFHIDALLESYVGIACASCQEDIEAPCPPSVPWLWGDRYLDGLFGDGVVVVVAHDLHLEGIAASWQVGIIGLGIAASIDP